MKQSDAFLSSEGNAWFKRNQCDWKAPMARRELSRWCEPFKDGINNILEIGAGSGFPLAFLANSLDSRATGIEPSQAAVERTGKAVNLGLIVEKVFPLFRGLRVSCLLRTVLLM